MLDQMQKRPGITIVMMVLLNIAIYAGLFVGALLFIKWLFF